MKNKLKVIFFKIAPALAFVALQMGIFTSNASGCFFQYQPEEPRKLKVKN
ncbi:MAG: cyclic lactone autoinducer peptide [Eubacterium sp.]|nr:cyclic lactone autoinducer peptide [Eubacterium sp.]